jgi:lamin tail-like protein
MHDVVRGVGQQLQLIIWPEDFIISPDPPAGGGTTGPGQVTAGDVLIVAALPDPAGADRGNELVTLLNTTPSRIELTGWALVDAAGGRTDLSGPIAAGGVAQVPAEGALQLGNQGDTIILVDPSGGSIDQVTYKADRVRPGRTICFGR